jgi:hypothetical protein
MRVKLFAESGHYTEMHNLAFDLIMPRVSANAWKALCLIIRKTKGWGKKSDELSYEQIKQGTGISSDTTVAKILAELQDVGQFGSPIILVRGSQKNGVTSHKANRYALNRNFFLEVSAEEIEQFNAPENGALPAQMGYLDAPENGDSNAPINGAHTPENEAFNAPENGALTLQKMETQKETNNSTVNAIKSESTSHARTRETPPSTSNANDTPDRAPFIEGTHDSRFRSEHFFAVCKACERGPEGISWKMRIRLAGAAVTLKERGYTIEQIALAAERWPYPTAPTPDQLVDNIQPLLNRKEQNGTIQQHRGAHGPQNGPLANNRQPGGSSYNRNNQSRGLGNVGQFADGVRSRRAAPPAAAQD